MSRKHTNNTGLWKQAAKKCGGSYNLFVRLANELVCTREWHKLCKSVAGLLMVGYLIKEGFFS